MKFIVNGAFDVPEVLGYILGKMLAKCPDSSKYIFSTSIKVDNLVMYAFDPSPHKSKSLGSEFL